jgi:hypothetical protein
MTVYIFRWGRQTWLQILYEERRGGEGRGGGKTPRSTEGKGEKTPRSTASGSRRNTDLELIYFSNTFYR